MKKLVFVFVVLSVFVSCTTTPTNTVGLLERPFKGSADFTSAVYDSYNVGCNVADSTDLIAWVKGKNNLPERTYALGQGGVGKVVFADKAGVIRVETAEESSQWLVNAGKISFIVVKDSTVIADFCMGKDPAPNFPGK